MPPRKLPPREQGKSRLYVIECSGYHKIGITGDIAKRLKDLSGSSPFPIKLVFYRTVEAELALWLERYVHLTLHNFRVDGKAEWFRVEIDIIRLAVYRGWLESRKEVRRRAAEPGAYWPLPTLCENFSPGDDPQGCP